MSQKMSPLCRAVLTQATKQYHHGARDSVSWAPDTDPSHWTVLKCVLIVLLQSPLIYSIKDPPVESVNLLIFVAVTTTEGSRN